MCIKIKTIKYIKMLIFEREKILFVAGEVDLFHLSSDIMVFCWEIYPIFMKHRVMNLWQHTQSFS